MGSPYKEVQLHVFDVSAVIGMITDYQFNKLVEKRVVELFTDETYDTEGKMKLIKERLIDDFLKYTINSFQICWMNEYSPHNNTIEELDWINHQQQARQLLYSIINLSPDLSGSHVSYKRIGSAIFLAIPKA